MADDQLSSGQIQEMLKTTEGLTPEMIFNNMSIAFKADQSKGENLVFQFELSGENGGTWYVKIQDQSVEIKPEPHSSPNITIQTDTNSFLKMVRGEISETSLFMMGKIKIKGNPMHALKFKKYFL